MTQSRTIAPPQTLNHLFTYLRAGSIYHRQLFVLSLSKTIIQAVLLLGIQVEVNCLHPHKEDQTHR